MQSLEQIFSDTNVYHYTNKIIPTSLDSLAIKIAKWSVLIFTVLTPLLLTIGLDLTNNFIKSSLKKENGLTTYIQAPIAGLQVTQKEEPKGTLNSFKTGFTRSFTSLFYRPKKIADHINNSEEKIALLAGTILGGALLFSIAGRFLNGKFAFLAATITGISGIYSNQITNWVDEKLLTETND